MLLLDGQLVSAQPIDAAHLEAYAAGLVDAYLKRPELVRLALWDRLERAGAGMRTAEMLVTDAAKVAAIAEAQAAGVVSSQLDPEEVLALVTLLSSMLPLLLDESDASIREIVTPAVSRLTRWRRHHGATPGVASWYASAGICVANLPPLTSTSVPVMKRVGQRDVHLNCPRPA
jgi:Tetracyclin repressor-like, C-terminal domain